MNQPPAIGPRLQTQRKARDLTLEELAFDVTRPA